MTLRVSAAFLLPLALLACAVAQPQVVANIPPIQTRAPERRASDAGTTERGHVQLRALLQDAQKCDFGYSFSSDCEAYREWSAFKFEHEAHDAFLASLLKSPDVKVRLLAAEALAAEDRFKDAAIVRDLIAAVANEKDPRVAGILGEALGRVDTVETKLGSDVIAVLRNHGTPDVRGAIASRLLFTNADDAAVRKALRDATGDPSEEVAHQAIRAFWTSSVPERCDAWVDALSSPSASVAAYAASLIGQQDACAKTFDALLSFVDSHKAISTPEADLRLAVSNMCGLTAATAAQKKRGAGLLRGFYNASKSDDDKAWAARHLLHCDLPQAQKLAQGLAKSQSAYARKVVERILAEK